MRRNSEEIDERVLKEAMQMIKDNTTVRELADWFGVSKSTVHKDVTMRLRKKNKELYDKVQIVLKKNKAERHMRGGQATREKYEQMRRGS